MAPKKQAKKLNAFALFAQELQHKQGRKYASMSEACKAAGPLWERMTKEQKNPYEEKAKGGKNGQSLYTSDGYDVNLLIKQKNEEEDKIEQMKEHICHTIGLSHRQSNLKNELFFIIHINLFCYCENNGLYYPAEIGVVAFDLEEGVKPGNIFHSEIRPGALPLGYAYIAKQHSEATHNLKVPLAGDYEDNSEEVFNDLYMFLSKKSRSSNKPILYAHEKDIKPINSLLEQWSLRFANGENEFKIYNLQYLFQCLRNTIAGEPAWSSDPIAYRELEKDVHAYVPQIACQYHQSTPVPLYCSMSIPTRYAFTICKSCCPEINIDLILGQHVPFQHSASNAPSRACSTSESSTYKRRNDYELRHDDNASVGFSDTWDTQSVLSDVSSVSTSDNTDDNFPHLGSNNRQRNGPHGNSNLRQNNSNVRNYAGATGRPHSIAKNFESDFNDNADSFSGINRGIGKENDNDFPALGNSRGSGLGRVRGQGRSQQRKF